MLSIFEWAARPVSQALGSVINHLSDSAASMNCVVGLTVHLLSPQSCQQVVNLPFGCDETPEMKHLMGRLQLNSRAFNPPLCNNPIDFKIATKQSNPIWSRRIYVFHLWES